MARQARFLRGYVLRTAAGLFLLPSLMIAAHTALADDAAATPAPTATPLPKSGRLASTLDYGYGDQNTPIQWGGQQLDGANTAPISGSVSRNGNGTWLMKVFNNSKDSYTADVEVIQLNSKNAKVKSDTFTISLAAGKSDERTVPADARSAGAALNLRSWKKTSRAAAPTPAPSATPVAALKAPTAVPQRRIK